MTSHVLNGQSQPAAQPKQVQLRQLVTLFMDDSNQLHVGAPASMSREQLLGVIQEANFVVLTNRSTPNGADVQFAPPPQPDGIQIPGQGDVERQAALTESLRG